MKTKGLRLLVLILASALFVGCALESQPYPRGGTDDPVKDDDYKPSLDGNVVTLNLVGSSDYNKIQKFGNYTGRVMDNPKNIQMHVYLKDRGDASYGGAIKITYVDRDEREEDRLYTGTFVNGDEPWYLSGLVKSKKKSAKSNKWVKHGGRDVFRGIFQDTAGGLVIVLDEPSDIVLGDGQISEGYNGSVYYRLYAPEVLYTQFPPPVPPTHCWFITRGPFDCRAWSSNSPYPGSGYIKLADFKELSIKDTFLN